MEQYIISSYFTAGKVYSSTINVNVLFTNNTKNNYSKYYYDTNTNTNIGNRPTKIYCFPTNTYFKNNDGLKNFSNRCV